ncbi:2-aminoadipate transaminase-like [Ptychodera flava]|uniref:2-aminoadipate transaminase-like n=1 Tax=Ptychodera flava TaxID=63121 RepID=UPI00396A69A7
MAWAPSESGERSGREGKLTFFNHYIEESGRGTGDISDGSAVRLDVGAPSKQELEDCIDIFNKATQHRMQSENGYMFQYGCWRGDCKFRLQMSKFLTEEYDDEVDCEELMVTCGATNGIYMVASLLFNRGDTVFVEDPSYYIAIEIFKEDLGMNVVPVPFDDEGIIIEKFEKVLYEYQRGSSHQPTKERPYWSMVYLIPTFNNPKGTCLAKEKCEQILKLARKYNILIFCDDVYNLLSYIPGEKPEDKPLPSPRRLFAYDKKTDPDYVGNVISNGSFSKILGPGLRIGWMEASLKVLDLIENSAFTRSAGGWNNYTSAILASALELGLVSKHLLNIRRKYRNNLDCLYQTFTGDMPSGVKILKPQGGYYIWIEFPENIDAEKLRKYCEKEYDVCFAPGKKYSPSGSFSNCARITITYYEKDVLVTAAKKICAATRAFCKD